MNSELLCGWGYSIPDFGMRVLDFSSKLTREKKGEDSKLKIKNMM